MAHEYLGVPNHTTSPFVRPHAVPPPPVFRPEATDGHATTVAADYALVRSALPVSPEECEDPSATALEVTALWGTNVLRVAHLSPPRAFTIGAAEGVDFLLPPELARERHELVSLQAGVPHVSAPDGAELEVDSPRAAREPAAVVRSVALRDGVALVRFGALCFRVTTVAAGRRLPRAVALDARGLGASFATTCAAFATLLGVLAYYPPALGASLDGSLDPEYVAMLRAYLDAQAEPERVHEPSPGEGSAQRGGGTPGTAAQGPEGSMGRPNHPARDKRFAIRGSGPVELSRHELIAEAMNFGTIGVLNMLNDRSAPTALWGADVPNGPDAVDAAGVMFAATIGEAAGAGGLGLIGPGSGAGGYGKGIGLGNIGTCGTDCGNGKDGFGVGVGRGNPRGHATKAPSVRIGGTDVVSGHIPREVIQRVVRQNYGRFRQCYEQGLRTNPNLTGRVTARFVIGRDGAVTNVANGGSDLPDSGVVGCVVSAFYGITFPAPNAGIVTVTYPIMLVPG